MNGESVSKGGWRYQPVYVIEGDERTHMLCEVHLDGRRRLVRWTEHPSMAPQGETMDELSKDICHMLLDAFCWEPIEFRALTVGMEFKRIVTMDQRDALAKMVTAMAHNLGSAQRAPDKHESPFAGHIPPRPLPPRAR